MSEGGVHRADELVDVDRAISIEIGRRAVTGVEGFEGDGDAADHLIDGHRTVAVTIASQGSRRRWRCRSWRRWRCRRRRFRWSGGRPPGQILIAEGEVDMKVTRLRGNRISRRRGSLAVDLEGFVDVVPVVDVDIDKGSEVVGSVVEVEGVVGRVGRELEATRTGRQLRIGIKA